MFCLSLNVALALFAICPKSNSRSPIVTLSSNWPIGQRCSWCTSADSPRISSSTGRRSLDSSGLEVSSQKTMTGHCFPQHTHTRHTRHFCASSHVFPCITGIFLNPTTDRTQRAPRSLFPQHTHTSYTPFFLASSHVFPCLPMYHQHTF